MMLQHMVQNFDLTKGPLGFSRCTSSFGLVFNAAVPTDGAKFGMLNNGPLSFRMYTCNFGLGFVVVIRNTILFY